MSSRKRSRTSAAPPARRPIDKQLVVANHATLGSSQQSTVLFTFTHSATVTGIRWDGISFQDGGTGGTYGAWAIVKVEDGYSANTLAFSDQASLYEPEQSVLAYGLFANDNNVQANHVSGQTKTMRKMKAGDQLVFISKGIAVNTQQVVMSIQFFAKE